MTLLLAALLMALVACTQETMDTEPTVPKSDAAKVEAPTPPPDAVPQGLTTLKEQLAAKKAEFIEKTDPAVVSDYQRAIDELDGSDILLRALKVGDKAPDFTLTGADGKTFTLSAALQNGPVVLVWYRGGWCPYCNLELAAFQQYANDFRYHGGLLVAISPDTPDHTLTTVEKHALDFPVLSDPSNAVAKKYGIVYTVPAYILERWQGKIDLNAHQGNERHELPLAATYVVGTDGVILYAFLDTDYRVRAEPSEIMQLLYNMKKAKAASKSATPPIDEPKP
jgi:peroxiredoxin